MKENDQPGKCNAHNKAHSKNVCERQKPVGERRKI